MPPSSSERRKVEGASLLERRRRTEEGAPPTSAAAVVTRPNGREWRRGPFRPAAPPSRRNGERRTARLFCLLSFFKRNPQATHVEREGMSSSTAAHRWNPSSLFQPSERSCRAMPPIHCAEPGFTPKGEEKRSPARSRRRRNPPLSMAELWDGLTSLLFEELHSAHGSPGSLAGCQSGERRPGG